MAQGATAPRPPEATAPGAWKQKVAATLRPYVPPSVRGSCAPVVWFAAQLFGRPAVLQIIVSHLMYIFCTVHKTSKDLLYL